VNEPVTWGPPRVERADAARNRRLLLVTARDIIAGQGTGQLTMDGLAERAGLGFCAGHGLSTQTLIDRMGGSP
jgi:AcrR family transcriptional regulator